jgi:hypothetical protein
MTDMLIAATTNSALQLESIVLLGAGGLRSHGPNSYPEEQMPMADFSHVFQKLLISPLFHSLGDSH